MLKVLIVDDEQMCREAVRLRLGLDSRFDVVGEADNGSDGLLLMQSLEPDLVFLDIEMPALNGLQMAKESLGWFKGAIVFVTAFSHYAVSAFDVEAMNYLVKPINDEKFAQVLDKVHSLSELKSATELTLKQLNQIGSIPEAQSIGKNNYLKRLSLKDGQNLHIVDVSTIQHVESAGDYLGVTTEDGVHIERMTMKQLEELLDPNQFLRCHRSHMVNRQFIASLEHQNSGASIKTSDGKRHPVSRRYLSKVKKFLFQ